LKQILANLYSEYGRYIDSQRAIPFENDCLKPVERRLLVSVHETVSSRLSKSAKVIGHVLANFHPHGDACLVGETKLYSLDNKIYSLKELYDNNIKEIESIGFDQINNKIVKVIVKNIRITKEVDKLYEIELYNGYKILCTDNHRFYLKNRQSFTRADELKPGEMMLNCNLKLNDKNYYNALSYNGKSLTNMLHMIDNEIESTVIHHMNGNTKDNSSANLQNLSRGEHAKIHINVNNLEGLERGRISMKFDIDLKNKMKDINSRKMKFINNNLNVFKANKVVKLMELDGVEISNQNYDMYRQKVYNAPFRHTLISDGIIDINNIKLKIDELKSNVFIGPEKIYKKINKNKNKNKIFKMFKSSEKILINLINSCVFKNKMISYSESKKEVIKKIGLGYGNINNRSFPSLKTLFGITKTKNLEEYVKYINDENHIVCIKNIKIIDLKEKIPVYDFTVDGYENTFIVVSDKDNLNNINLVCTHNSSYSSLVSLVNRGIVIGQGNWGRPGYPDDSPPAAMRYTECQEHPIINNIISELLPYVPHEAIEIESEPLYLPSPIPIGLIGDGLITGIGFNITKIPRYNYNDLLKRLYELLTNANSKTIIKPSFKDCVVKEINVGDFEKILTKGSGEINVIPVMKPIDSSTLSILGKHPITGWTKLKSFNKKHEDDNDIPFFEGIDMWNIDSKTSCDVYVNQYRKKLNKEFVEKLLSLISGKINVKVNVVDENTNTVKQVGIDHILLQSYNKWKLAYKSKFEDTLAKLQKELYDLEIIELIRYVINSNNTTDINVITSEIVKLNSKFTEDEVVAICNKYRIRRLIDGILNKNKLINDITDITNKINNLDLEVLNILKTKFLKI
jgi:DNA gyrase/topoisomerase IV subunit A